MIVTRFSKCDRNISYRTIVTAKISKTQIDRLGDRLKQINISESDLQLLDQYRRSFNEAYEFVIKNIRKELSLEPTGRAAKSTLSISEKLRRESIRLTQIQDIAGCRLIVSDIAEQEKVVDSLCGLFEHTTIIDRRQQPSHGYRAVHVIVKHEDKAIEIQVRTALQHLWAELSEKLSDKYGQEIKYGRGNEDALKILVNASDAVNGIESTEIALANQREEIISLSKETLTEANKIAIADLEKGLFDLQQKVRFLREQRLDRLRDIINKLS